MRATELLRTDTLSATLYCCAAGPADRPFAECHAGHTLAYVRRGSFGYRAEGRAFEMVAGSVLIGCPGGEYVCTHEHHGAGDDCVAFTFSAETVATFGAPAATWRAGALAPLAAPMVAGALTEAAACGRSGVGIEEAGLIFAAKVLSALAGTAAPAPAPGAHDRRRAVEAALFLDAHAGEAIDPGRLAAASGLSKFHFLRVFTRVLGVTPHQYLLRARLRRAALLLAQSELAVTGIAYEAGFGDLSHFIRFFHRAAGLSPRRFRARARGERNFRQAARAWPGA